MIRPTFDYIELANFLVNRFKSSASEDKIRVKIHEHLTNKNIDYTLVDSSELFKDLVTLGVIVKIEHSSRPLKVWLKCSGQPPFKTKYKVKRLKY